MISEQNYVIIMWEWYSLGGVLLNPIKKPSCITYKLIGGLAPCLMSLSWTLFI